MSGRRVRASAKGPTSKRTIGSASWTKNPDEIRPNVIGYGARVGVGNQLYLSSYSYTEPYDEIGTVAGFAITDSMLFVETTNGERWGEGNQFGQGDDLQLVVDPSTGYIVYPQYYAARLTKYSQINNVFGGGKQIGISVDILINVKGPSLKHQTSNQYSSGLSITKLSGAVNE